MDKMEETRRLAAKAEICAMSAYWLAHVADCASPDSSESAGAMMLRHVADGVCEALGYADEWDGDALRDDMCYVADGAPSVYTARLWAEFVDLGAYAEDPTDLGFEFGGSNDVGMEDAARVCLYMIAERLACELVEFACEYECGADDAEAGA